MIDDRQRDPTYAAWLDRFFESYYRHRPVNATFIGVRGYDSALPDFSEGATGDLQAEGAALLAEAAALRSRPSSDLTPSAADTLDLDLATGFLELQQWEYASSHFHRGNPSFHTGEAIFGVLGLFLARSLPPDEQIEAALARMDGLPAFLNQARNSVRHSPPEWNRRAMRECDSAIRFFTDGWRELPDLARSDTSALGRATDAAARAFSEHRAHLDASTEQTDAGAYSAGPEALALYLEKGHFLAKTAEEIGAYARKEMRRAQAELESGATELGAVDPDSALDALRSLHPRVEDYYQRYTELWTQCRERAEGNALLTWPDFPIEYVPRPEWARAAAPGLYFLFYRSPAAINRPAVHHYLVTPIEASMEPDLQKQLLNANNDSVIKLNHVLHHGSIGHHVQNWHAFRSESRVGRVAAVDCASRIAMFSGLTMAEGWACYATDLIAEFGGLTELERLAEVNSRVRMCARAVVDIELHTGRMTLDEAAGFYRSEARMPEPAAVGEAVKNSMFPGGALIYLMGSDAIRDLRRDLEAAQGSAFSLRNFHDAFLSFGSIPVSLAANAMRRSAGLEVQ